MGNRLLVGASLADVVLEAGAVYLFEDLSPSGDWGLVSVSTFTALDATADESFGESVALGPMGFAAGAPRDTNPNGSSAGSVYVFVEGILFADHFESGDTSRWSVTVP